MLKKLLLSVAVLALSSACDWVDSTGIQEGQNATPLLLDEGTVVSLLEGQGRTLDPANAFDTSNNDQLLSWQPTPLQQGRLPACSTVEGYAAEYAADNLEQACYDAEDCEIYFEPRLLEDEQGERTVFMLAPPVLKAPVGLTYQLTSTAADGLTTQANFTFCLIAENEPPVAVDDVYPVVENQTLVVGPGGLLSNDADDTDSDVRNQPLSVVLPAVSEPALAESFELFADGSFTYTVDPSIVLAPGSTRSDVFEYQITDGTHTDNATVLINIVAADAPPVLLEPIAPVTAIVGIESAIVLAEYFSDPEGGELTYTVDAASLPPSNAFVLDSAGVLSGTAQAQDIGNWQLLFDATDISGQSVTAHFILSIVDNQPPQAQLIPLQSANTGERFSLEASQYFSDPEGVELSYALAGVQNTLVAIDRVSGRISGFFNKPGEYELIVSVSDGVNPAVSQSFITQVVDKPNQAPSYSGLIANQTVQLGQAISSIKGNFSDPDGDTLSYSMLGNLPPGLQLSPVSGVISGKPGKTGVYPSLFIVATDPHGATARSDGFSITVTPATPNRKPRYQGQIPNQTITLGTAIAVIEGDFSDPDDDPLTYSVVGTLPAGLSLSADGVLTGRPLQRGISDNMRLRASDPGGLSVVSDLFRIVVTAAAPAAVNLRPEYTGSIEDRSVKAGTRIQPIKGSFSDPDGDKLRYVISGKLPPGLAINRNTGVVSGTPKTRDSYGNLRIEATDGGGLSAQSDRFAIIVD